MIPTGTQIREGRLLTGLSQSDFATVAGVTFDLLSRAELADGMPMIKIRDAVAIRSALEAAGVEFIPENGGGAGVRLRKVELKNGEA